MAGAACLRGARHYGMEIMLLGRVAQQNAEPPLAMEATRVRGIRLEQIDDRARALEAYVEYLQRRPKHEDALALGKRAVCLARSLGLEQQERFLLAELQRLYGRKGFVRLDGEELMIACEEEPSS